MVKTKKPYVQVAIEGWPIGFWDGLCVCVLDGPVFRISSIGLTHFGIPCGWYLGVDLGGMVLYKNMIVGDPTILSANFPRGHRPHISSTKKKRHFEVSKSDFITKNRGLNLFTKQKWFDSETYWAYSAAHIFGLPVGSIWLKIAHPEKGMATITSIKYKHMGKTGPVSIDIVHMTCIYTPSSKLTQMWKIHCL